MLTMQFDRRILATLPFPDDETVKRIGHILSSIVEARVMPYFKKRRGTDSIVIARLLDRLTIRRFEDEQGRVQLVSMIFKENANWQLAIHESIFDYLAFVIPSDPEARLGDGTLEERKMLAFVEFVLRHDIEHMLYPDHGEKEIVHADMDFAMARRSTDPTFYNMLRQALADEMNGIEGEFYLSLLDRGERQQSPDAAISRILDELIKSVSDLPASLFQKIYSRLDREVGAKVLGECYRRSRDTSFSLGTRSSFLHKIVAIFPPLAHKDKEQARDLFNTFKERWGMVSIFQELGLPEKSLEEKRTDELFELFLSAAAAVHDEKQFFPEAVEGDVRKPAKTMIEAPKQKSLKDRIEEAKENPRFPPQVLALIEKNKLNAVGHSGAKYSELIETLLAVPWGKIHKIEVSPEQFEKGLNESHYGLKRPKEIVCDFFTNLIWRYRSFRQSEVQSWHRMGSAFLFVGPPGVGKTSLAISIAQNLGIPYHKFSLGGMRDEADLRGHGFTYEGSKPGAIVQGLIKMGAMNGMFILDEADKTEKFAIATLLEILDPEQNHLFHDKYTQTTVDIDISNCHFILTANTLETVPAPVADRCEVVFLNRYGVEEKVAIARQFLIQRIRSKHKISEAEIYFAKEQEQELLKYLIKNYTYEAGVRQLERTIRTLFLRLQRKEILAGGKKSVQITRQKIKALLEEPLRPRQINDEDRIGEVLALGVNLERGVGTIIPIQATPIRAASEQGQQWRGPLSLVHATGNIEKVMDESRKVATTGILSRAEELGIDIGHLKEPIHLHFMGGSTPKDGPSAGSAIALALSSLLAGKKIRRDVAVTGEIDTQGRITAVGGLDVKLETACDAGCKTVIIPRENLHGAGGLEQLPDPLKEELHILSYQEWQTAHQPFDYARHVLQVVGVDHIVQAADIALIDDKQIEALQADFIAQAETYAGHLPAPPSAGACSAVIIQFKSMAELNT
ncbi:MAG: AAA family ATPase, partial [Deltaproteobacteria bacterium]|nr:AAA family ATPase [Deltaproteobacteria bacterium]